MLVAFSMPMLAQNPQDSIKPQIQELFEQFYGQNGAFWGQNADSTFTIGPDGGVFQFYNFSDMQSLDAGLPMKEMQKMMEQLGMMMSKGDGLNAPQLLDFQKFMQITPDSLMQQIEPFFGEDFRQLMPNNLEEETGDTKKKRKTYSL